MSLARPTNGKPEAHERETGASSFLFFDSQSNESLEMTMPDDGVDRRVLILRAQANKVAHRVGRVRKLAEHWIEGVWRHEELRITGSVPVDPVDAQRYEKYANTRPTDRLDVYPHDRSYMRLSCAVWAEIERQAVAAVFERAAFYDGVHSTSRVDALQRIVDAAVADGRADALDEDGQVPDVPSLHDATGHEDDD